MKIVSLDPDYPETWLVGPAVDALRRGELVILPTDSIYALACDPWKHSAVAALYAAKRMEKTKRCSVMCGVRPRDDKGCDKARPARVLSEFSELAFAEQVGIPPPTSFLRHATDDAKAEGFRQSLEFVKRALQLFRRDALQLYADKNGRWPIGGGGIGM